MSGFDREKGRIKAKAVAYELAAVLGVAEASRLMREAANAIEREMSYGGFNDPGGRP